LTSVEEHFAPLDATVEGLGLILFAEINYCDNICLRAQGETAPESREDLQRSRCLDARAGKRVGSFESYTTANRLVATAPPRK